MLIKKYVSIAVMVMIAFSATGCSTVGNLKTVKDTVTKNESSALAKYDTFDSQIKQNKFSREADGIWVSGKTVTEDKASRFDNSWMKRPYLANKENGLSFYNLLNDIEVAYPDITVSYNNDIPNYFLLIDSEMASSETSSDSSSTPPKAEDTFISYTGDLEGFFDSLASKKGFSWNMVGDKHVEFTFQETETFKLNIMGGALNSSASVSLNAEGGSNSMNADYTITTNLWDEVIQTAGTFLSTNGSMTPSQSTGTFTVKDSATNLVKISNYVDSVNREISRQVMFDVKVYKITKTSSDGYGLDWNAVYSSVRGKFDVSLANGFAGAMNTSPLTSLTANILMPNSPYNGSSAIVSALSTQGGVSIVTETKAVTMNNMPVPISQSNEISYIESQSAATTDANGNVIPGAITPGSKTVGFYMVISPRILENDKLMLQMSIDLSDMTRLVTRSASADPTSGQIQTPEIARNSFFQRVIMNSGETLMLTGFSKSKSSYTDSGIGHSQNVMLGGSKEYASNNEYLVMLVTPRIAESSVR